MTHATTGTAPFRPAARWIGAALLGAALLGLVGCGRPLIPSSAPRGERATAGHSSLTPAHQARPLLGVDLYAGADYPLPAVTRDGARDLAYMHTALGAQAAGIVWNLYSPGTYSDSVQTTGITLSPAGVAALTRQAQALGMSIQYRPLIRLGRSWRWEGYLRPSGQQAWFASLFQAELPYLRLAQRLGVGSFVVASELRDLNASPLWPGFLARVRSVYHGSVSVAEYQSDYFARQLLPVATFGVDAYPDTGLPDGATQAQLGAAWRRAFLAVPAPVLANTTMDEVGFIAESGGYSAPQQWRLGTRVDWPMQARWFTAACQTAAADHMRGIYFYEVNLTDDPAHPNPFPAFFERTPGSQAIHGCLRIFQARQA